MMQKQRKPFILRKVYSLGKTAGCKNEKSPDFSGLKTFSLLKMTKEKLNNLISKLKV